MAMGQSTFYHCIFQKFCGKSKGKDLSLMCKREISRAIEQCLLQAAIGLLVETAAVENNFCKSVQSEI